MSLIDENMAEQAALELEKETIVKELIEGKITALAIDTCILRQARYGLEHGTLKQLEQFRENAFHLLFSEITSKEAFKHMRKEAEDSRSALKKALVSVGNYWNIPKDKRDALYSALFDQLTPEDIAKERLTTFMKRCGAEVVLANEYLDVSTLLKIYFSTSAPFESSGDKKSEFPDAIALLSLEEWAKRNETRVLFVTADKGCQSFCSKSERLVSTNDLGGALSLIQQRDAHTAVLCEKIANLIKGGSYPKVLDEIYDTVARDIWDVDWSPDASSAFYFDSELEDVGVSSVEFKDINGLPDLETVDYRQGKLVVRATMDVSVHAACSFVFFTKDYYDKDMVTIGDTTVSTDDQVELGILLTFANPNSDHPEVENIELIPTYENIYFGTIEPSWDEDR